MHLQTSVLGGWFMFYCQFGYGPGESPGHANMCPNIDLKHLMFKEFPKQTDYTD